MPQVNVYYTCYMLNKRYTVNTSPNLPSAIYTCNIPPDLIARYSDN